MMRLRFGMAFWAAALSGMGPHPSSPAEAEDFFFA